jgi:hypothetical protein
VHSNDAIAPRLGAPHDESCCVESLRADVGRGLGCAQALSVTSDRSWWSPAGVITFEWAPSVSRNRLVLRGGTRPELVPESPASPHSAAASYSRRQEDQTGVTGAD